MTAPAHSDDALAPPVGDIERLVDLGESLLGDLGAGEQIEVVLSRGASTSVEVHAAEVESFTSAGSAAAGVRVLVDGRLGFASCGTLAPDVLAETLREARDNCRFSEPDEANALGAPDGLEPVRQETWFAEVLDLGAREKVERALSLEAKVIGTDARVTSARSTSFDDGWAESVVLTSTGVKAVSRGTTCSVSTQPLATEGDQTQIGWGYDVARRPDELATDRVVSESVDRATKLLGAGKPPSARMAIVLEPRLAMTLLGLVAGMLSAESVQKGRSPFADRVGEQIASPLLDLVDDPTRTESLAADEFDGEGLACRPNRLITGGVLDGFLYDSTSARREGVASTASAVRSTRSLPGPGAQLLVMAPGSSGDLLSGIGLGLAVESFAGLHSGVNPTSGDFSVGANGLMIRDGSLAEPVQELTIASSIQRLLTDIAAIGSDFEWLPSGQGAASVVIEGVSVSGT
ncbi:MAG: TldD/PmbA family protein [Microthrixaceae bacterium]